MKTYLRWKFCHRFPVIFQYIANTSVSTAVKSPDFCCPVMVHVLPCCVLTFCPHVGALLCPHIVPSCCALMLCPHIVHVPSCCAHMLCPHVLHACCALMLCIHVVPSRTCRLSKAMQAPYTLCGGQNGHSRPPTAFAVVKTHSPMPYTLFGDENEHSEMGFTMVKRHTTFPGLLHPLRCLKRNLQSSTSLLHALRWPSRTL